MLGMHQTRSDGTQVWAEVRDHTIINGGYK